MKKWKAILIVVVILAVGIGITAVGSSVLLSGAVALDDVLARPGHHLGESVTVVASDCVEQAPVFGHRAWKLSGEQYEVLLIGSHAPATSRDQWIAQASVEALELFGHSELVLVEQAIVPGLVDRVRGVLPRVSRTVKPSADTAVGEPVAISGRVERVSEAFGFGALLVDVDGDSRHVVCEGYVPPEGAVVRVAGTERTVLDSTDFATEIIETGEVSIPIGELRARPATYNGQQVRVVGTVTSNYSLFCRSVYGVQDEDGAEIEVWSAGAGHAPDSKVAVIGSVRHVAGWGRHQIIVLVEQAKPDEEDKRETEDAEPLEEVTHDDDHLEEHDEEEFAPTSSAEATE